MLKGNKSRVAGDCAGELWQGSHTHTNTTASYVHIPRFHTDISASHANVSTSNTNTSASHVDCDTRAYAFQPGDESRASRWIPAPA